MRTGDDDLLATVLALQAGLVNRETIIDALAEWT